MNLNSSPIPLRRASGVVPASPSAAPRYRFKNDSDEDELANGDNIPCSQSPYFTQPTQIVTQPTQLVGRTSLRPSAPPIASSPRSEVEVPASSPFQPRRPTLAAGRLSSLIAPAGTVYRAPMAPPNQHSRKRELAHISDGDSDNPVPILDSSDDETPARGDIRPSYFKRSEPPKKSMSTTQVAPPSESDEEEPRTGSYKVLNDRKLGMLAKRTHGILRKLGLAHSLQACSAALQNHHYSVKNAVNALRDQSPQKPALDQAHTQAYIRSFAHQPSQPSTTPSQGELKSPSSPSPKPKRRKLVQGRREPHLSSSQPQPSHLQKTTSFISLLSEDSDSGDDLELRPAAGEPDATDDDDCYDLESCPSPGSVEEEGGTDHRVLRYLNTCEVQDLVAMLGARHKAKAEALLSHRPFRNVAAVLKVSLAKKSRGKNAASAIGEEIFDDVRSYVVALQAIDVIVAQCEDEGSRIKRTINSWNRDFKGNKVAEPTRQSLTPSSADGRPAQQLVQLPIPQEPEYMQGHCVMKSYQLYGLNWMWQLYQHEFGCILADDMGLGKTCQVVSFLSHLVASYDESRHAVRPWPNLVVVPPSTLANWQTEFRKFAPDLVITVYQGDQNLRADIATDVYEDPAEHHVILTSYSQLNDMDAAAMRQISPHVTIYDEGHKLKNNATKLYQRLVRIPAKWRLILTGTPVQNNLMEMINLLHFIQPSLFGNHLKELKALFSQKVSLQDVSNGALLFSDRVRRARSILEPFILQRRKEQVLSSLPKKTYRVVYCDMDKSQKPIYEAYERQFRSGKEPKQPSRSSTTGLADDQNNVWVQLRKAAIHAQLFRRYFDDDKVEAMAKTLMLNVPQSSLKQPNLKHLINELKDCSDHSLHLWCTDEEHRCIEKFDVPDGSWMKSGKVKELITILKKCEENGDRALVFTRFAKVLNILRDCLQTAGIESVTLEGQTRVEDRQDIIDIFNTDNNITAFCLTTLAGGTGLNLTGANKVIIFDQSDNPQDDVQAENRAHRLGQTRDVEVIRLITRDTIEELVHRACQKKLELANRVTGWTEEDGANVAKQVEEEVRKMLLQKQNLTPPKSENGGD